MTSVLKEWDVVENLGSQRLLSQSLGDYGHEVSFLLHVFGEHSFFTCLLTDVIAKKVFNLFSDAKTLLFPVF